MEQGIVLGMLGYCSVEDIRKRTISGRLLMIFGLLGLGFWLFLQDKTLAEVLLGIGLGVILMVLSLLTRGSIGLGDGLLLVITGIFLGGAANVELLMNGLLYGAIFSLGVLAFGKGKKNREIPFVPFLFLGYLTMIVEAWL